MDEKTEVETEERTGDDCVLCIRGVGDALDRDEPGTIQEAMSYIAAFLGEFSGTWMPTLDGQTNHLGVSLVILWKWLATEGHQKAATSIEPRGEGWSL